MLDLIVVHMLILFCSIIGIACVFIPCFLGLNAHINNKFKDK
jgi:hypothetical protein